MTTRNWIAVVVMLGGWAYAGAQEQQPTADPHRVEVPLYEAGKGASFPELLPADLSSLMAEKCDSAASGEVEVSFVVDAEGQTHNVTFVHPIGSDLDRLAIVLARANRFKPAMLDGSAVAVALTDKIKLKGCAVAAKNTAGQDIHSLRFHSQPEQHLGAMPNPPSKAAFTPDGKAPVRMKDLPVQNRPSPPVAILTFDPSFSNEARQKGVGGSTMISMTVDAEGIPYNLSVVRPAGNGLDEKALEAVLRYRFKPALLDGIPIAVYLTVEVNFRLCPGTSPCR